MSEIAKFLKARLNEDDAFAAAAAGDRDSVWAVGDMGHVFGGEMEIYNEGHHTEEQSAHIARHDPARVLREVKAKRSAITAYEQLLNSPARQDAGTFHQSLVDMTREQYIEPLAAVYSDHPDYRTKWNS